MTTKIVDLPLDVGIAMMKSIDNSSQISIGVETGWRRLVGFEQSGYHFDEFGELPLGLAT